MFKNQKISVIIPAHNEAASIGKVVEDIPDWVDEVIVVDNASTDATARVAAGQGARVVLEKERGYGAACLAGIAALTAPDIVVFLDGDYSDHPEEMELLIDPIVSQAADLVIGSRTLGERESGSMTVQARAGNGLACFLIRYFWRYYYTDLGPFRAVRFQTLQLLKMKDRNYGWTIEMQIKAALLKLPFLEMPVRYRRRIGTSKISGTMKGVINAGLKIIGSIVWARLGGYHDIQPGEKLVIFTRYPQPGRTKTRLIPTLGSEGAADLQRQLTEYTLTWARQLRRQRNVDIEVCYTAASRRAMQLWLGYDVDYVPQGGGDLGEKMAQVFRRGFARKFNRILIVGIDCPSLNARLADQALDRLARADLVLGPAHDGGYYLIAANRYYSRLFKNVAWGTGKVLEQTLAVARDLKIQVAQTEPLHDLDYAQDLPLWNKACHAEAADPMKQISVIIPVLNEEPAILATLNAIDPSRVREVIVVDGGSRDRTVALAGQWGAKVVSTDANRGAQMHAGARAATGNLLLFVHGDTLLPKGFDITLREVLSRPMTAGGAFTFALKSSHGFARWIERSVAWRSRWLQLPFGDQGLMLHRSVYKRIGGFSSIPLMEDYDIVRRLKKTGAVVISRARALTSGRRWQKLGWLKIVLINQALQLAYRCGADPRRLVRWYHRHPEDGPKIGA